VWNKSGEIGHSLKAASIRHECEQSLRRLKVDTIDLYQIHWPIPDEDIEQAWTELAQLKKEGKVRYIGVSNFDAQQMQRAIGIAPITSLQPPYSLLARQAEGEILPFATHNGIGVIVYSPMYSGLLSGKMTRERIAGLPSDDWRRRNSNFQEPLLSHNLRLVEVLREIGLRHEVTAGEVAIAWTLSNLAVTGAIVGVRSREQVLGIIEAGEFRLSAAEVNEIGQAQMAEAQELSLFS
jgi:aryl-alcohol dehydrogenase-like predicted oxidoreductase